MLLRITDILEHEYIFTSSMTHYAEIEYILQPTRYSISKKLVKIPMCHNIIQWSLSWADAQGTTEMWTIQGDYLDRRKL